MAITDHKVGPDIFDNPLRIWIPSQSSKTKRYLVDLSSYSCNGQCQCLHFTTRLEPLIRRNVPPQQAIEEGWVKVKPGTKLADVYRCKHVLEARDYFADTMIRALDKDEKVRSARNPGP